MRSNHKTTESWKLGLFGSWALFSTHNVFDLISRQFPIQYLSKMKINFSLNSHVLSWIDKRTLLYPITQGPRQKPLQRSPIGTENRYLGTLFLKHRTKAGISASICVFCFPLFLITCLHTGMLTIQRVSIKSILSPSRLKADTNYHLKPPVTLNSCRNPPAPIRWGKPPTNARKHTWAYVTIFDEYDRSFQVVAMIRTSLDHFTEPELKKKYQPCHTLPGLLN